MRAAIFSNTYQGRRNPFTTPLWRLLVWTRLLWTIACIARGGQFSEMCPDVSAWSLPPPGPGAFGADGISTFLQLALDQWKGNTGSKQQVRGRLAGSLRASLSLAEAHCEA